MNAAKNLNPNASSTKLTALSHLDRLDLEGFEERGRLLALPGFVITFSITALLMLSVFHSCVAAETHNAAVVATMIAVACMAVGLIFCWKLSQKVLISYSVVCAIILGILVPLSW